MIDVTGRRQAHPEVTEDMPDINFDCPHCSQNLEAPEDMAGDTLACPACGQDITVPVADVAVEEAPKPLRVIPAVAPVADAPGAGACPQCKAPLAAGAVICINCGFNLKTGRKIDTSV
jgi:transcription elongation factor Elf1